MESADVPVFVAVVLFSSTLAENLYLEGALVGIISDKARTIPLWHNDL